MKKTTTGRGAQGGPDFGALLKALGKSPAMVEVEAAVSMATVYRAKRGLVPGRLHLRALAAYLGVTEPECRAAIERSAKQRQERAA